MYYTSNYNQNLERMNYAINIELIDMYNMEAWFNVWKMQKLIFIPIFKKPEIMITKIRVISTFHWGRVEVEFWIHYTLFKKCKQKLIVSKKVWNWPNFLLLMTSSFSSCVVAGSLQKDCHGSSLTSVIFRTWDKNIFNFPFLFSASQKVRTSSYSRTWYGHYRQ